MLVIAAALGVAFSQTVLAAPAAALAGNPLATASSLPFQYPAFDKIKDEHFIPAFKEGMRIQLKEVDAIANNKAAPTFENTIVAMEKSGVLLTRVQTVFYNLQGANTNDKLDAIDSEMSPKLAAHSDAIYLNPKLWARVKSLYEKRDALKLDAEAKHLLERYHTDFVRAGAKLSDADKAKLKVINGDIAKLQTAFTQNVLKETNASALVVDSREELAGMSDAAIDAAAAAAKAKGLDGKFLVAVVNTSGQPPLAELTNRATREKLMALSLARGSHGGEFDSRELVLKIAKARAERPPCWATPTSPPTRWKTRPRTTPPRSTSCWASWPSRPSTTPRRKRPTCKPWSMPKKAASRSAPPTGPTTPTRCARSASPSTRTSSSLTSN
jgi:peptidyl-dipeptidase Dcp